MNILGVKITGHDTGAALIADKKVIAIAEERLNRVKHSPKMFPHLSIEYCLNHLNIAPKDIDMVLIDQINLRSRIKMAEIFERETRGSFSRAQVHVVNHHDAHAASAFFCSPFEEAAVLVYDGTGEKFSTHLGVSATETDTLYVGRGTNLYQINKNLHLREGRFFPYTFGIGKLYSYISEYCNFGHLNEGKLMGLAPYGDDSVLKKHPYDEWCREYNGTVVCNSRITYPGELVPLRRRVRRFLRPIVRFIQRYATEDGVCYADLFPEITLEKPKRTSEPLPDDPYYTAVARAAQNIFERVALLFGRHLKHVTGLDNLCVAGGCGLNIDANMNFLSGADFKNIFVQPASSDTGISLGLALYGYHVIAGKPRFYEMKTASLGRAYSEDEILEALHERGDEITYAKRPDIASEVARLIRDGRIIGWFYGGGEYGPRALGHRSILCDARGKDMRDILNMRVKHREPWRPFAASVLAERVGDCFDYNGASPFMLLAARVTSTIPIPSVTHVDGTCRIQTVTEAANGRYYDLIRNFYELTGTPLILNTSFNLGGEPIVESPRDALKTFLATEIDYLVIDDYLISKKKPIELAETVTVLDAIAAA